MAKFDGYLFSKLHLIGSKSEGPTYILQQLDYSEVPVIKKAMLWQEDPVLHKRLDTKVTVQGKFLQGGIEYENVSPYRPGKAAEKRPSLQVQLRLGAETLTVHKVPGAPPVNLSLDLTLMVKWPYRSIWHGLCPTSQIYDFSIERKGKTLWQWSKGMLFLMVVTPVTIPGGAFVEFPVTWNFSSDEIEEAGTYTARAIFIASGQEATKDFTIKFCK